MDITFVCSVQPTAVCISQLLLWPSADALRQSYTACRTVQPVAEISIRLLEIFFQLNTLAFMNLEPLNHDVATTITLVGFTVVLCSICDMVAQQAHDWDANTGEPLFRLNRAP